MSIDVIYHDIDSKWFVGDVKATEIKRRLRYMTAGYRTEAVDILAKGSFHSHRLIVDFSILLNESSSSTIFPQVCLCNERENKLT